jgi:outer membrane protein OmpA-like peptidoglycan-associated protein
MRYEFTIQPEIFEFETELDESEAASGNRGLQTPGAARRPATASCPPQAVKVDCPAAGTPPTEVLDNFEFDKTTLSPTRHIPRIAGLARRIIASQGSRSPIQSILIAGHTDVVGDQNYNFNLGWRRATAVMNELCNALERTRRGVARSIRFQLTSGGERQPKATPPQSRRVEMFVVPAPGPKRKIPPDHNICGVPRNAQQAESGLVSEIQQLRRTAPTQTVRPRLSIFQNASNTSHRNHFQCQATRWARRIAAIASPDAANCRRRVGPTAYDTGADVIRSIEAARTCVGRNINAVHIFSHSGSHGVFGSLSGSSVGLYSDAFGPLDANLRRDGARLVSDIPTTPFSQDVVFVLHGCNAANGDDNFARSLFDHLAATLRNPRVYGHPNTGCAGRDNSWREYSRRSPDGRQRPRSIAPHYEGKGCCS